MISCLSRTVDIPVAVFSAVSAKIGGLIPRLVAEEYELKSSLDIADEGSTLLPTAAIHYYGGRHHGPPDADAADAGADQG